MKDGRNVIHNMLRNKGNYANKFSLTKKELSMSWSFLKGNAKTLKYSKKDEARIKLTVYGS